MNPDIDIYLDGAAQGPWMGHYLGQLGCIWLAESRQAAVERAPEAIAGYLDWLWRHGEADVAGTAVGGLSVRVAGEQMVPGFGQSGAAVGLFEPDHRAVTDETMATAVRRLGYARREVLETVLGLDPAALDLRAEGKRSVRENLEHIANAQGFYLTRVLGWARTAELLPEPWPDDDPFERLRWVLAQATKALLELPPELREGSFPAERPRETWTPRKMLRRFVEHELEHLGVLRRTVEHARAYVDDR